MPRGRQTLKKINGEVISKSDREAIEQMLKDGFRYKEIAEVFNVTEKQVNGLNYFTYKVDIHDAYRNRLLRDGLPVKLDVSDPFGYWFAGLFDGEGCLSFRDTQGKEKSGRIFVLRAAILMRADNNEALTYVKDTLGIGSLYLNNPYQSKDRPNSKPRSVWQCAGIAECCEYLIPLFDRYELRTKKAKEYPLWKEAGTMLYQNTRGGQTNGNKGASWKAEEVLRLKEIAVEIRKLKKWDN